VPLASIDGLEFQDGVMTSFQAKSAAAWCVPVPTYQHLSVPDL